MKKTLMAISIFLCLSALAAAKSTTYNFIFATPSGDEYCDSVTVTLTSSPKTVLYGTHNNWDCDGSNTNIGGFKATVAPAYQYLAKGATFLLSDPFLGGNESATYQVNPVYGTWVLDVNPGGTLEVLNYGVLEFAADAVTKGKGTKPSSERH